ncbi:MAG: hypothetical protein BWX70_03310 [Verrucomicrobia bacterium ADurb.Bin070]|nr:MAG: hypothetical protein BWX70_03310 [Verrucomicrobia bacterium ADurb.Bin070]
MDRERAAGHIQRDARPRVLAHVAGGENVEQAAVELADRTRIEADVSHRVMTGGQQRHQGLAAVDREGRGRAVRRGVGVAVVAADGQRGVADKGAVIHDQFGGVFRVRIRCGENADVHSVGEDIDLAGNAEHDPALRDHKAGEAERGTVAVVADVQKSIRNPFVGDVSVPAGIGERKRARAGLDERAGGGEDLSAKGHVRVGMKDGGAHGRGPRLHRVAAVGRRVATCVVQRARPEQEVVRPGGREAERAGCAAVVQGVDAQRAAARHERTGKGVGRIQNHPAAAAGERIERDRTRAGKRTAEGQFGRCFRGEHHAGRGRHKRQLEMM